MSEWTVQSDCQNRLTADATVGFAFDTCSGGSLGTITRLGRYLAVVLLVAWGSARTGSTQQPDREATGDEGSGAEAVAATGIVLEVPVPLTDGEAGRLMGQLRSFAENVAGDGRRTIVLRYPSNVSGGSETGFETALKFARAMTSADLRRLKLVSWVEGEVDGHSVLPLLASDLLIVGPGGAIGDASAGESSMDETVTLSYQAIADRRALFPAAVVASMVDPGAELVRVDKVGGGQELVTGEELNRLRGDGEVLREEVWSPSGTPLQLDSRRLRDARIASQVVDSAEDAAELLGLARLESRSTGDAAEEPQGVLVEVTGSIASNRMRRWQSNLSATLDGGKVNTWLVTIDSHGGDLSASSTMAARFARPTAPLQTVAGVVRGEARGDAALIAMACKPLLMMPGATLGGGGADAMPRDRLSDQSELIAQIARETRRPEALIRGLLDRETPVYRYTHRRTGRVRYAAEGEIGREAEDPELERDRWERGERIELDEGLSADDAIALGLADGRVDSVESAARRVGLDQVPPPLSDRRIVRFVERIGRSQSLAFFLLFLGFVMLSSEASAPGIGIPGFISLLCFGCFFWIKFLAGTAEWLELLAFGLGLLCIGIELFVVPGVGIFGVGGVALTMLGVVLMSQTFVIPRNAYQVEVLTKGIWIALGSAAGLVVGIALIRALLPSVPLFRGLVMEAPDGMTIDTRGQLADFTHLEGCDGTATTSLRPSGKARFGDQIVAVVSDGTSVAAGEPIRVIEVRGNRIVVEPREA